jgi:hypothetical protein
MNRILVLLLLVIVSGCAGILPSFWDDNQSRAIIDVRHSVRHINCAEPHLPQVQKIQHQLEWFQLYSESKGYLQKDVLQLIEPMQATVQDFVTRSRGTQGTKAYCEIKKQLLDTQSRMAAQAVLARF